MSTRVIGLNKNQPVPRLLTISGRVPPGESMRDVPVDAAPVSDSDSDNEGLSRRGDIQSSKFLKKGQEMSPPKQNGDHGGKNNTAAASRGKRIRPPARPVSKPELASSPRQTGRQSKVTKPESISESPVAKRPRKDSPEGEQMGSQFEDDFMARAQKTGSQSYGKSKFGRVRVKRETSPSNGFIPPPNDETPKLVSPRKNFKVMPDSGLDSQAKSSPIRKRGLKRMPKEESPVVESQRPVFSMPDDDDLPDSFLKAEHDDWDFTISPAIKPSNLANLSQCSSSSLTDLDSLDATPVCPLCNKEVDGDLLDDFKRKHPRMNVSQMQKFCQQHKKKSAKQTWLDRGYPDIDWLGLDARIAQRYNFLRGILKGDKPSFYDDAFRDTVGAGQNRTLFQSDANLTPGYYGIRGLRAMSENLIGEFSALLRQRALQDRLVSARGHTAYLQSVLVPELAVQLIMEDMEVGEKEAREVLKDSCWVGELLNDEIADVVLEDDDDDDDGSDDDRYR